MKTKNPISFLIKIAAFLLLSIIIITSCKKEKIDNDSGNDPIPVEPGVAITNPLCFTAEEGRVSIEISTSEDYVALYDFEYSYDNVVWNRFTPNYSIIVLAEAGEKVYFRGHNLQGINPFHDAFDENNNYFGPCAKFKTNDKAVALSGNVMSLIDTVYREKPLPKNCFFGLFAWTSVTSAPELPATTMSSYCYGSMFANCSNLTTVPELPATTLADYCYSYMFFGCVSLSETPELSAMTLAPYCYQGMFSSCHGLTTTPELLATTMAPYSYENMFSQCMGLTTARELPATTLAEYCYHAMFQSCYNLTTPPDLPATSLSPYCYSGMFADCDALTRAPELPAPNLVEGCYCDMFACADNLSSIKVYFTEWLYDEATYWWLGQTATYGTFYCPSSLPQEFGFDRIPENWTVETF